MESMQQTFVHYIFRVICNMANIENVVKQKNRAIRKRVNMIPKRKYIMMIEPATRHAVLADVEKKVNCCKLVHFNSVYC